MSGRQIVSSTLWQLVSQATMALLSVITVKCVAVGLSVELAGYYNSSYGFLQLFGILADFGLYAVAIREMSRAENKAAVLGALLTLRAGIVALSLGSALLIAWLLPAWRGTPLPLAVSIASLVPALTLLAGVLRSVFQVHHKMQFVFVAEVTQRIVTVVLLGGAVWMGTRGSTDIEMLYLFLGFGSLGALTLLLLSLIFAVRITTVRPTFDLKTLRSLFVLALPYGIAFLFMALYRQTDVSLIAILRPDFARQNAMYGFVQRVMDMAYLFPTFLLNSTLPHLQGNDERTRALLGKTLVGTLLLSGGAALYAWFWATPLMELLTTGDYLTQGGVPGADASLKILSLSIFANGLIVLGFYTLLSAHAWRSLVSILGLGAVVALTMNLRLIPAEGFMGASVTSASVHILLAVLLFLAAFRAVRFSIPIAGLARWALWMAILGGMLFFAAPFLTSPVSTLLGILLTGLLSLLLAWAIGILRFFRPAR